MKVTYKQYKGGKAYGLYSDIPHAELIVVASMDGVEVGHIALVRPSPGHPIPTFPGITQVPFQVSDLLVLPKARGLGIASELLMRCTKHARKEDVPVILYVKPYHRGGLSLNLLIRFYKRYGLDHYKTEGEYFMALH